MRIAIVGDTHFGFQWGTERGHDSFIQAQDAFEKACVNADLILQVGDLFDTRVPKPEIISEAMKVLFKPLSCDSSGLKISGIIDKKLPSLYERTLNGIPVVAIHGTHDRRSHGLVNPVEAMEQAGFLLHLDRGALVFEKDGERVAVHGFGGVPERFAGPAFKEWDPKPVDNATNIMLLHQSFSEYIYSPLEPPTMNLETLPGGFDLFVNGHIHCYDINDLGEKGMFLLSGSTIVTQITKMDVERPKYVWFYDTQTKQLTREELRQARKIYLHEIDVTNLSSTEIRNLVTRYVDLLPRESSKPIVKIRLSGKLSKGVDASEIYDSSLANSFLIIMDKRFDDYKLIDADRLRSLHETVRMSSEEMGIRMLHEELGGKVSFDPEDLFRLLCEGDIEGAFGSIEIKTKAKKEIY